MSDRDGEIGFSQPVAQLGRLGDISERRFDQAGGWIRGGREGGVLYRRFIAELIDVQG